MKRYLYTLLILFVLFAGAGIALGQTSPGAIEEECPLPGTCVGTDAEPLLFGTASASLDEAHNNVTISVAGHQLGADHDFCQAGDSPDDVWEAFVGDGDLYTLSSITIVSGPSVLQGQTLTSTFGDGAEGVCGVDGLVSPGGPHSFSGSKVFDVSSLGNATYSVILQARNSVGETAQGSMSFTINRATAPTTYNLSVLKNGTGSGTVTSAPSGISCGSDCSQSYEEGTPVTLTPNPATVDDRFDGWTGHSDCGDGVVTMSDNRSCTATFTDIGGPVGPVTGVHQTADGSTCTISGWAVDPDDTSVDVGLKIYSDGALISTGSAGQYDSTLENTCAGGTCAFSASLGMLITRDTNHSIRVDAIDINTGEEVVLSGSPKTINCPSDTAERGTGTITVSSNRSTSWTIGGPQNFPGSGTSATYTEAFTGTYTITPSDIDGFSYTVSPSTSRSLSANGTISFTITYIETEVLGGPTLSVTKSGSGSGRVTSSPSGINCGNDCSHVYPLGGWQVTLTPDPDPGSVFAGWTGDSDCSDGTVFMFSDRSCNAVFNTAVPGENYTLTVTKAGAGSGDVTSIPKGINCGKDCDEVYGAGMVVTLNPKPKFKSNFSGWSGDPDCSDGQVTMDKNKTCTATFGEAPKYSFNLSVEKEGDGTGHVTSIPVGTIDCGSVCAKKVEQNRVVELIATPDEGSTFVSWKGADTKFNKDCESSNSRTQVQMNNHRNCVVTFGANPGTITVNSNTPTTWELTGPSARSQATPDSSETYTGMPAGTYQLLPATDDGRPCPSGYECDDDSPEIEVADVQTLSAGGSITFTVTYEAEEINECNDTIDNDGDGLIDGADPACVVNPDNDEDDDPECSDETDNADTEDTLADTNDPGCHTDGDETNPLTYDPYDDDERHVWEQCRNTIDDDGDGKVDWPDDPGCTTDRDEDELDATNPQCSDGLDNDSDNKIDWPDDPGCSSAADNSEIDQRFEEF